jgi:hypothetical protein
MKKSIALFVTIIFLFIVIGILSTILLYTQKLSQSKNFYIAQNSLIIKQTVETLNNISEEINSSEKLQMILNTFPIPSPDNTFRIMYTIKPLYNKIDINSYLNNGRINTNIDFFLNNLFNYYQIQDPQLLKDLILDTLDKDNLERESFSEIILQNPDFQNGKIYNFFHFMMILKQYYKLTEDKSVFHIPWKKYIFFGNGEDHIIECNLLNKQMAEFLGLKFEDKPTCKNILTNENNQIVNNFDIIEFKNQHSFLIKIIIDYFYNNFEQKINIIYDIHEKKVISVESNPIY